MALPLRLPWNAASDRWATYLNPLLSLQPNNGGIISNISLIEGSNVINHLLGRKQQGWILTDQTAAASIYRSADFNNLTLTLTSSEPTTVSLWVF